MPRQAIAAASRLPPGADDGRPADLDAGVIEEIESHVIGLQLLYLDHYDTRQVPLGDWEDKRPEAIMREG